MLKLLEASSPGLALLYKNQHMALDGSHLTSNDGTVILFIPVFQLETITTNQGI